MTGIDVSYDHDNAVAAKPRQHRSGGLSGVALTLLPDADDPRKLSAQLSVLERQRGLNRAEDVSAPARTDDPVQPTVRPVRRAPGGLPGIAGSQQVETGRLATMCA
jgi:hypothetical protein